mgnify:FL=1
MSTDTTPERRLTERELFQAIGEEPTGWNALMPGCRLFADAQLAKADAWWRKREAKLVEAVREFLEERVGLDFAFGDFQAEDFAGLRAALALAKEKETP